MTVGLLLSLLTACAAPSPKKTLADYLEAEQTGRYDAAHALLSPTDQAARPLEAYAGEHLAAGPIWLAVARTTRFELGAVDKQEGHVRVTVRARHAEHEAVAKGITPPPADKVDSSSDPTAFVAAWVEQELERQPFPMAEEELSYALQEAAGGWRVWLGLDRQDAAIAALRDAESAERRGDDAAAAAAIARLHAVPPDPAGVVEALQAQVK